VHTLPAVALVKDTYPNAKITWVINPEWSTLLRGNPDIDHVHIFPRGDFTGLGAPDRFWPWLKKTRELAPDLALDFQGLFRSAFIGRASRAKKLYGMSDGREGSKFFYHRKAKLLHSVSQDLLDRFDGKVPGNEEDLLSIKGVGKKTANLVLGVAFDIPAICVDTHVHRVSNRLGLVKTKTTDQTEQELKKIVPQKYWIE